MHITDPWDPLRHVYENLVIENEHEIALCKACIYIKLLDYNFKYNVKAKCSYISLDGTGSYRQVVNASCNTFEDNINLLRKL